MRGVVISDNQAMGLRIRQVLTGKGHDCRSEDVVRLALAGAYLQRAKPDLVAVEVDGPLDDALALVRQIRSAYRGPLLAIGETSDSKKILRILREGADHFVDAADLDVDLAETVRGLREEAASEAGRLIALLAPCGGSGVSTLAVNIAASLAKEHQSCGLLDLRLESGDLPALLDLQPAYTLADLCAHGHRLDDAMFERALVTHASGIRLLAASLALAHTRDISADGVSQAVALARHKFPYVVADVGTWPRENVEVVLRLADIVLIVFRLDFVSVRNTRRLLEHLAAIGIPLDRVQLVANRYGQPQEISAAKAEDALRRKIVHYVPDDAKVINLANNSGVPAVSENPRAKVCQSLMKLAQNVNGRHQQ